MYTIGPASVASYYLIASELRARLNSSQSLPLSGLWGNTVPLRLVAGDGDNVNTAMGKEEEVIIWVALASKCPVNGQICCMSILFRCCCFCLIQK